MKNEKVILDNMLAESKISKDDYKLLSGALDKKSSDTITSLLINPFQKIAGFHALVLGAIIIIAMSFVGIYANIYFEGVFGCTLASSFKNAKIHPNFFFLLYENVLSWFTLSMFFIIAAKIFKQKRIRIIDFFGTVALARLPYLVLVSYISLELLIKPDLYNFDLGKDFVFHFSIMSMVSNFIWSFCYIWQIATYFYALKESSGLIGKKLWVTFLISVMTCEMIGLCLTRMFLGK